MAVKQLSVFIENQQGKLVEIMDALATNDISIRAISVADTTEFGILRLIVNRPNRAERVLNGSNRNLCGRSSGNPSGCPSYFE